MQVHISNRWTLKPSEVQTLVDNGRGNSINWWCLDQTTNQFIKYEQQIGGKRIPGDQQFEADLDLEPGEYRFGCGKWDVIDQSSGRHCSQTFYVLVDDEGAHVLKRNELPSQGGTGRPAQTSSFGTSGGWGKSTGGWGSKREEQPTTGQYFLFPHCIACLNEMKVHDDTDVCASFDPRPDAENECCAFCDHGVPIYVKRD